MAGATGITETEKQRTRSDRDLADYAAADRSEARLVEDERVHDDPMWADMLKATTKEAVELAGDPGRILNELQETGLSIVKPFFGRASAPAPAEEFSSANPGPYTPVVQMHGMGDAANNPGMVQIRRAISKRLEGTYVTNIALGSNRAQDAGNTFFLNMDGEVEQFADRVRADPRLLNGFNAIGYSQGNLIIRGYIERYNKPPVHTFVSMHGPLAGVAGFPNCRMSTFICRNIDRSLGTLAYTASIQDHLAQANYFRDPLRISEYVAGAQFLPDLNNEVPGRTNPKYVQNFQKIFKLVLIRALEDTEIVPSESEWFGYYADGSNTEIQVMENTTWYNRDSFGLKTLHELGRIDRLTTPGNHLEFSEDFLMGLVDQYFKEKAGTFEKDMYELTDRIFGSHINPQQAAEIGKGSFIQRVAALTPSPPPPNSPPEVNMGIHVTQLPEPLKFVNDSYAGDSPHPVTRS